MHFSQLDERLSDAEKSLKSMKIVNTKNMKKKNVEKAKRDI